MKTGLLQNDKELLNKFALSVNNGEPVLDDEAYYLKVIRGAVVVKRGVNEGMVLASILTCTKPARPQDLSKKIAVVDKGCYNTTTMTDYFIDYINYYDCMTVPTAGATYSRTTIKVIASLINWSLYSYGNRCNPFTKGSRRKLDRAKGMFETYLYLAQIYEIPVSREYDHIVGVVTDEDRKKAWVHTRDDLLTKFSTHSINLLMKGRLRMDSAKQVTGSGQGVKFHVSRFDKLKFYRKVAKEQRKPLNILNDGMTVMPSGKVRINGVTYSASQIDNIVNNKRIARI